MKSRDILRLRIASRNHSNSAALQTVLAYTAIRLTGRHHAAALHGASKFQNREVSPMVINRPTGDAIPELYPKVEES